MHFIEHEYIWKRSEKFGGIKLNTIGNENLYSESYAPGFRFVRLYFWPGHFIDLIVYFPCQNCRHSRHYCNNYCLQIVATLKDVHFHCTAYLDWYFRCHDHLSVVYLLHLRLLNMVNLIFCCAYRYPCWHLVVFNFQMN